MPETALQERIWGALNDHRICMMTRISDGRITTRPMSGHVDRESHRILFITHRGMAPPQNAREPEMVSLAISDEDHNFYAAIACRASELDDRALLGRIWNPILGAWFPNGPDDPDVTILVLDPLSAEIWEGPSSGVVIALKLATAKILGRTPDLGGNTTIDMR